MVIADLNCDSSQEVIPAIDRYRQSQEQTHLATQVLIKALASLEVGQVFDPCAARQWQRSAPWPERSMVMPIRAYRDLRPIAMNSTGGPCQGITFESSGTTSQHRSRPPFSEDGLTCYRAAALLAFDGMLEAVWGHSGRPQRGEGGISLVPPYSQAPQSSLAWMIDALARVHRVRYCPRPEDLHTLIKSRAAERLWIFGTAAQLASVPGQVDAPGGTELLIIETGGTKVADRPVDRATQYAVLCETFGISHDQIVSEYGMSELASQAYDFVPHERRGQVGLGARRFVWPAWVEARSGPRGELVILDRARVDFNSPLATEDSARDLYGQSFVLGGRLPRAPAKGCSLTFGRLSPGPEWAAEPENTINLNELYRRAAQLQQACSKWILAPTTRQAFSEEFDDPDLGAWAQEDLSAALPASADDWVANLQRATADAGAGILRDGSPWLVVAPRSHSLACLELMSLLALAGATATVRLPQGKARTVLASWVDALNDVLAPKIARLDAGSLRIKSPADAASYRTIVCMGSDTTLANLRHVVGQSTHGIDLVGFGSETAVAWISGLPEERRLSQRALIRDVVGLRQRGCRSVREVWVLGALWDRDADLRAWVEGAIREAERRWGISCHVCRFPTERDVREQLLARQVRTLAVLQRSLTAALESDLGLHGVAVVPLGATQRLPWTGVADGRPLFCGV